MCYKCTIPPILPARTHTCYCGLCMVAALTAGENVRLSATVRSVTNVIASDRRKSSRCRTITRVMLDQEPPRELGHLCALL